LATKRPRGRQAGSSSAAAAGDVLAADRKRLAQAESDLWDGVLAKSSWRAVQPAVNFYLRYATFPVTATSIVRVAAILRVVLPKSGPSYISSIKTAATLPPHSQNWDADIPKTLFSNVTKSLERAKVEAGPTESEMPLTLSMARQLGGLFNLNDVDRCTLKLWFLSFFLLARPDHLFNGHVKMAFEGKRVVIRVFASKTGKWANVNHGC
jgi:hypothetical protein